MKEFSLLFFFIFFCLGVQGQSQDKGNVFVTGVVCDLGQYTAITGSDLSAGERGSRG